MENKTSTTPAINRRFISISEFFFDYYFFYSFLWIFMEAGGREEKLFGINWTWCVAHQRHGWCLADSHQIRRLCMDGNAGAAPSLLHKHVCTLIGLNCATRESEPIYRDLLRQTLAAAEADINWWINSRLRISSDGPMLPFNASYKKNSGAVNIYELIARLVSLVVLFRFIPLPRFFLPTPPPPPPPPLWCL